MAYATLYAHAGGQCQRAQSIRLLISRGAKPPNLVSNLLSAL